MTSSSSSSSAGAEPSSAGAAAFAFPFTALPFAFRARFLAFWTSAVLGRGSASAGRREGGGEGRRRTFGGVRVEPFARFFSPSSQTRPRLLRERRCPSRNQIQMVVPLRSSAGWQQEDSKKFVMKPTFRLVSPQPGGEYTRSRSRVGTTRCWDESHFQARFCGGRFE